MRPATVVVVDFGAQYVQLIARRVRENHVHSVIVKPAVTAQELRAHNAVGLIFSGGPDRIPTCYLFSRPDRAHVCDWDERDMTKARARERAKAKAARKSKGQEFPAGPNIQKVRPGQFDPGQGSIKSPGKNAANVNFAGARRGAPRSR